MKKTVTRIERDEMGQIFNVVSMVDMTAEEEAARLDGNAAAKAESEAEASAETARRAALEAAREKALENMVTEDDILAASKVADLRAVVLGLLARIERLEAEILRRD